MQNFNFIVFRQTCNRFPGAPQLFKPACLGTVFPRTVVGHGDFCKNIRRKPFFQLTANIRFIGTLFYVCGDRVTAHIKEVYIISYIHAFVCSHFHLAYQRICGSPFSKVTGSQIYPALDVFSGGRFSVFFNASASAVRPEKASANTFSTVS